MWEIGSNFVYFLENLNFKQVCNMFSNFEFSWITTYLILIIYINHLSLAIPGSNDFVDLRQSEGATLKTKTMTCIFFQTKYFYLRNSNKDFLVTKDSLLFSQIKKMPGKVDKIARCEPMLWTISIFVRFHVAARSTKG